jgi:hypothetical protein
VPNLPEVGNFAELFFISRNAQQTKCNEDRWNHQNAANVKALSRGRGWGEGGLSFIRPFQSASMGKVKRCGITSKYGFNACGRSNGQF